MTQEQLQQLIESTIPGSKVIIDGEGCHCQATVITDLFEGKSRVARQQMVFEALGKHIASGELHAITLKTRTPQEWGK